DTLPTELVPQTLRGFRLLRRSPENQRPGWLSLATRAVQYVSGVSFSSSARRALAIRPLNTTPASLSRAPSSKGSLRSGERRETRAKPERREPRAFAASTFHPSACFVTETPRV